MAALELLREQPRRVEKLQRNARRAARGARRRGLSVPDGRDPDPAGDRGRRGRGGPRERARAREGRLRPGHPPADGARGQLAAAADRDGLAHALGAARRGARGGRLPPAAVREGGALRAADAGRARPPAVRRPARRRLVAAVALARRLRNGHGHGGRQVGRRGVDLRGAGRARGERVAAFKPAVTGLDEEPGELGRDHELLASAASAGPEPEEVAPYRFGPPVSPHLAAELAGADDRAQRSSWPPRAHELLVCEGVGGLLVPITPGYLVRDLAVDLALPVVIAARPGSARSTTRCSRSRRRGPRGCGSPRW